jgi:Ca2+-binding EF-hand superfamily protein
MPSLRSLHINLHEEEQVDFIFRNMPSLEMLNDTEVEREEFEGEGEQQVYEDDEDINDQDMMNGEQMEQQMQQQMEHQMQQQEQPEGEEEPSEVEEQEESEPHSRLEIQQQQQDSDQDLVQEPEDGEGEEIENENEGDEEDIVIKPEDLEIIAVLYDSIRELRRRIDQENDKNLADDFDRHLKNVMTELNESITTDDPKHIKNSNLLRAKFSLYEICFTKAVEYMKSMDEEVGNVFERIQDGQNSIFGSFYDLTSSSGGDPENMRNQLIEKENEANEVIETANALNVRFEKEMKEKENIMRSFDREKAQLRKQVESLEQENKKLLDTLIRHSKGDDQDPNQAQNRSGSHVQGHPLFRGTQSRKYNKLAGPVGKTNVRSLTLKQLKDVIGDMYAQKLKYDQKCVESKLPRETMEQFMYTYLNQRYGLKSLIIEWVAAIINGIKTYLKQDHDVALFGKILKNECDEEFRFIQTHVKETLVGLLKALLRERFALKSESDINRMMKSIEKGTMEEWQWRKIIEKMYDPNDYEILEQKFVNSIQEHKAKTFYSTLTDSRKLTREEQMVRMQQKDFERLQFTDFQKIILDFQLKEHEKFLERFIDAFKSIDNDNNGVINEVEFRELVQSMEVINDEDEVNYLLQMIDPFNNQQMTFSELVHLFSSHMVPADDRDPQRSIPLLEKFVSQNQEDGDVNDILKEEDSQEERDEDDEAVEIH